MRELPREKITMQSNKMAFLAAILIHAGLISVAGAKVTDLCRKYGISDATYYNWKAKYGGMTTSDARRLKELEEENRRLKKLVADLSLDNQMLKEVNSKNW